MEEQNRPGVIRLLVYIIVAAGLAGGVAGWVHSSGSLEWAESLLVPTWSPDVSWVNIFGIISMQLTALSLWLLQRSNAGALKLLCTLLVLGQIAAIILHLCVFFGERDVTLGFLISLALWAYSLITTGLVGRCDTRAGFLLWPVFIALSYGLALSFEVMRLNGGGL